ncbi:MAG: cytochrome-c peroxidase [Rhodomicrobium sp.]
MKIDKSGARLSTLGAACTLLLLLPAAAIAAAGSESGDRANIAALKKQYARLKTIPYPADNLYSKAKSTLGKILYFDPRISASGTQSCATCHNAGFSWTDSMALAVGNGHKQLGRKSPTILNLAWDAEAQSYMWDGRKTSLEDQASGPMFAPTEMGTEAGTLLGKINAIEGYKPLFNAAFPKDAAPITVGNITKAIATYERTIVSAGAPFDRWVKGNEKAISDSAKRGFVVFNEKGHCAACHSGWRFSDGSFHDIGVNDDDIGRGKLMPKLESMQHAFKTVGLRNIALRGPYMHNGSLKTLNDVIDHYDHGFVKRPSLSDDIKPLYLTGQEKGDLVAFLQTLTSKDPAVTVPALPK